jgi:hypothetical protein
MGSAVMDKTVLIPSEILFINHEVGYVDDMYDFTSAMRKTETEIKVKPVKMTRALL